MLISISRIKVLIDEFTSVSIILEAPRFGSVSKLIIIF